MKILLIDDMRGIFDVLTKYGIPTINDPKGEYKIARNFDDGIKALKEESTFDLLFLDHDLASFDEGGREKTGYDIACFLEANPEFLPKKSFASLVTQWDDVGYR